MAEDLPSREILEQLVERLDHLERVLQANTARLHVIERRLGVEPPRPERPRPSIQERYPDEVRGASSDIHATEPARFTTHATPPSTAAPTPQEASGPRDVRPTQDARPPQAETRREPATAGDAASGFGTSTDAGRAREAAAGPGATFPYEATRKSDEARAGAAREGKPRDIESLIGGSWFNWIGIIAVTFGVAFFLKLAFDNQWIGPGARVALGAAGGLALLVVGERLRGRGMRQYAFVLSGGGILILYLSIYAAYNFYQLVAQPVAFLLMAVVTAAAVLLSVRLDALPVAILGLAGGFLTPVLLSANVDREVALFTYISLLDAGVLGVAYFKRWRSLDFLSFAGTVLMTLGWALRFYANEKLATTLFFVSVFFVLYSLLALFHNVLPRRRSRWFDVSLLAANATFYFGLSYLMLAAAGYDTAAPASQALLVSAFFAALFYAAWRRSREDVLLTYSYVGAAATFFAVALAIQLELHWVTIAWSAEALALAWVGLRSGERAPRHAALGLFGAAVVHWFAFDMQRFGYGVDASFVPLLNRRALSCAALVGATAAAAALYRRAETVGEDERSTARTFFALAGNAAALAVLTLDINDYFAARAQAAGAGALDVRARVENARQFSVSALWTLYAATLLALGVLRRFALLRWIALLMLGGVIGKVASVDATYYAAAWHILLFNHTFVAFALLVAALAFGARLYARGVGVGEAERIVAPLLVVAANVLALAALSLEAVGYYTRAQNLSGAGGSGPAWFDEGKVFALALVWTVYGVCAFLYGARRAAQEWRYGGLVVLALSTPIVLAGLLFYDSAWHAPIFNRTTGGFALLVAALWLVVRAYARAPAGFDEQPFVRPAAIVVANVLAVVALSAEAAGYFDAGRVALADTGRLRDLALAKQLSLSVVWALYGAGLLVAGRVRRLRLLRLMSLALLSLTTLKVFFIDLSSLDRVYRIISFIVLGAILLAVSYLYQRSQQRAAAEESGPASVP